jgi:hypothetical protein
VDGALQVGGYWMNKSACKAAVPRHCAVYQGESKETARRSAIGKISISIKHAWDTRIDFARDCGSSSSDHP